MTPEHWSEVEEVYQSAMDQEPAARSAYLDQACEGNPQLRRDVDSLLVLNDAPLLVDQPAWQVAPELLDDVDLPPGAELGPYRIEALLGAGGMGRVYRARDPRLGRSVALKIPTVEFNERFEREARTVAALNHPNICTLYDVGPNYLVMELVEGPTLADRIKEGPLPIEEAFGIAGQIATALEVAHEQGIVHRDLKPGNIKIRPDGTVKVLDFGLAQLVEPAGSQRSAEDSPTLTLRPESRKGVILGTAAYMSPEQARGKRVDKRADIWAFGVMLYEMLTGQPLFQRETVSDILAAVITDEPVFDRFPPQVRNLLRRCLEKDPKHRLRDIGDAMPMLEGSPAMVVQPTRDTRWIWPGVAALSLIAACAVSVLYFRETPPARRELIRFQIPLPEGLTSSSRFPFAVSPDGRRLAFFAAGSDGVTRFWLRALDSLETKPVPGSETNDDSPPFWSPDSRYLVFGAGGKLKKIDLTSGAVQTLCDVPMGFGGGSWNRDGVILFGTTAAPSVLIQISAAGGVPSPVTTPSGPATRHVYPTFLPDGRHFLYLSRGNRTSSRQGAYIGSLDIRPEEQDSRRLLADETSVVYVPSPDSTAGQLLFLREGNLMAQPFDAKRLQLTGQPVVIAELETGVRMGWGAFSAVNDVLVYRSSGARQLVWFDREGTRLEIVRQNDSSATLSLSPSGGQVAVTAADSQGPNVWIRGLSINWDIQSTFGYYRGNTPIWSPDGSRIVYCKPPNELYRKAASGAGDAEPLLKVEDGSFVQPTDWSHDGQYLIYTQTGPQTKSDIWAISNPGGDPSSRKAFPVLRTDHVERAAVLSPDRGWIAYLSDQSGREEVWLASFDVPSGGTVGAHGKWRVSQEGGVSVRWPRDSKELFYTTPDGNLVAVDVGTLPAFQGAHRKLFRIGSNGWDVSPDGKRFLASVPSAKASLAPFTVALNWNAALRK